MIVESEHNVFLYWVGNEYKVIKFLRALIYHHSCHGKNYKVHLITKSNISEYIDDLPKFNFDKLSPPQQADLIRVNLILKYGGIWLDSDTVVMNNLKTLFDIIRIKNGFFVTQPDSKYLCNGVFGSRKNTELLQYWKESIYKSLNNKVQEKNYEFLGNSILKKIQDEEPWLLNNYEIFNGEETLYPIHWKDSFDDFINKPFDNFTKIERKNQPLIILTNRVYKGAENLSEEEILNRTPLSYFIRKSYNQS